MSVDGVNYDVMGSNHSAKLQLTPLQNTWLYPLGSQVVEAPRRAISKHSNRDWVASSSSQWYFASTNAIIEELENRLSEKKQQQDTIIQLDDSINPFVESFDPPLYSIDPLGDEWLPSYFQLDFDVSPSLNLDSSITPSISLDQPPKFVLSSLLRSDLNQLFFERAYPFVPILHPRQYLRRQRQTAHRESYHIRDSLYETTLQLLAALESRDNDEDFADIEHVQARVLLLIYDFMRTNHQRGWMSAGRCFRLVQLLRLGEIDSPNRDNAKAPTTNDSVEWIRLEERRRTFWMAYSLDRFISARHEWPLTLSEQIWTRLPASEEDFLYGNCVQMGFLSEALASVGQDTASSPFTDSIIVATICGRAFFQNTVDYMGRKTTQFFWEIHGWLYMTVKMRSQNPIGDHPSAAQAQDSMLLFTNMMAQTAALYLYRIVESTPWEMEDYPGTVLELKQYAFMAAQEIVRLAQCLPQLSYLKVHPFTPLPLILCVDFLDTHRYLDDSVDLQVRELLDALKALTEVNNLAQDYLSL
ncbi:transcriptional activator [Hyphodiscus hymeniophilus]|uniref:Transcriptional activator n=1 Tax=Hyphodiscus hymeniophilus TaxID=353542 RepID=A0A9P6VCM3_9HELO|nr:transcriptional activator [Hyphodiscus hymeniophilus]